LSADEDYFEVSAPHGGPTASGVRAKPAESELEALREQVHELSASHGRLEDQIRQLHRVKTVMDLLAGVAHDMANALTGIVWCAEALKKRINSIDADLADGLTDFVGVAEYSRTLARRLVSISGGRDSRFDECRIQDVVNNSVWLVRLLRPRRIELLPELNAPAARVWGSAEQLQQIVVNLASNAFDALGERGGTVRIELDEVTAASGRSAGPAVRIRVSDTGRGMTHDTLRRAFEPFFTTKAARDGNGLGLAVVKGIVERHQGWLRAQSTPGQGTTIEVTLPCIAQQAPGAPGDGEQVRRA
jgi:two-component system cell cycle sensor histidine kinase/response regulator CckA